MEIEINDDEIDVREIISKMKKELNKHNITEKLHEVSLSKVENNYTPESTLDLRALHEKVDILNRSWNTNPEFNITSHRKYLGPIIVKGKKLIRKLLRWYINPYASGQNEFNANLTRTVNELFSQYMTVCKQFELNEANYSSIQAELENKNEQIRLLKAQVYELSEKYKNDQREDQAGIANANALYREMDDKLTAVKEELTEIKGTLYNKLSHIEQLNQSHLDAELITLKQTTRVANERLRRIERKLRSVQTDDYGHNELVTAKDQYKEESQSTGLDFDYYLFEEYFRGSREEIIERQKQYLPYFSQASNVLDLGCGRGEFTELMWQQNINVVSIDIDDDMVEYCRERGFNIKKADLISYLQSLEDNSVEGIFLGQVIEHMKPEDIINMVKLAYKKLKPNCWLIAETPNPRSLSIFAQSFYLDLTHNKPIHPFTAQFIWESEGFREVEVNYFSPNNPIVQLPSLSIPTMDPEALTRFNTGLQHWNEVVFGNQDYFVAGKK
ncbi:class I SAM-dependent methyltransferase [Paenibacillus sp. 453mf]|uniref:class I SAM-dependent methyltransferase n=1 Tax=Paenibacillus sp. 453mf TaxID=1761874 RepID=UPI0008EB6F20|nr:class I SAM-dependent methyltransferase [Paenibacillus sp. 453mf]SFS84566.1 O-antigen chain-terminating methyltransferase [Paenibacillus sp. 453mf]